MLSEFLGNRRPDAIETISRAILPEELYQPFYDAELDPKSRRLFYTLLAFFQDYRSPRYLLLYENGEQAGHLRSRLIALAEHYQRHNKLKELIEQIHRKRPNIDLGNL